MPELWLISPRELVDNPLNPRRGVGDQSEFSDLVSSVKEKGVLEPLLAFVNDKGKTVLLAGARRKAAALEAKVKEVPVMVRPEPSPAEQLEIMLDENGHRDNLHPIEEGNAYLALQELGKSQAEIAKACSRSEAHVSKRLAIVKLPDTVLDRFDRGAITLEAAYELTQAAKAGVDDKTVEKLAGQMSPELIKQGVKAEIKKQKDAKTEERLKARAEKEGVTVVSAKQLDNHTVAALAGQKASYHDTRLALDVATHVIAPCHGAVIRKGGTRNSWEDDGGPQLIYVCTDPTSHTGIATMSGFSGEASVDEINRRAEARNQTGRSAGSGGYEPPKQSAAEKKKIAVLQKQFDGALAVAEKRRAHLGAHVRTVSHHTLLPLLEAAVIVGFTGEAFNYGGDAINTGVVWPMIEPTVDAIGDDPDEIIANAGLADDGAKAWLVATAMAIGYFEQALFSIPQGRDSFTVTNSNQDSHLWTGYEDPRGLAIYLDWVASTGWEITSAETDVLEVCWASWRRNNPDPIADVVDGLAEGDEIPGTDGAMAVSDEEPGQADDE